MRISAEALKISEFSDNSRKIGSRKIAAGCLDFFFMFTHERREKSIMHIMLIAILITSFYTSEPGFMILNYPRLFTNLSQKILKLLL